MRRRRGVDTTRDVAAASDAFAAATRHNIAAASTRALAGTFLLTSLLAGAAALNPALRLAGQGMGLLQPVFTLENKAQAAVLGAVGGVDADEVKAEINAEVARSPCVIYTYRGRAEMECLGLRVATFFKRTTPAFQRCKSYPRRSSVSPERGRRRYGLSPFSTEAIALLKGTGAKFETIELGPEWFLLGPKASVKRAELEAMTGQSSLPHVFIGGEHVGGLATGPGLAALQESGELSTKLSSAGATYPPKSRSGLDAFIDSIKP